MRPLETHHLLLPIQVHSSVTITMIFFVPLQVREAPKYLVPKWSVTFRVGSHWTSKQLLHGGRYRAMSPGCLQNTPCNVSSVPTHVLVAQHFVAHCSNEATSRQEVRQAIAAASPGSNPQHETIERCMHGCMQFCTHASMAG
jgi:hypothetical protein